MADWFARALNNAQRLPSQFDPSNGVLSSFLAIIESGIGATLVAIMIGLASIPTGIARGVSGLLEAAASWATEFVAVFFDPFTKWVAVVTDSGGGVTRALKGTTAAGELLASMGALGYLVAIALVGLALYAFASGVSKLL